MAALTSPTLERLIREIRVILNQPKAENSRWSDAELGNYVNDAIQKYFLVINEAAEGQFDKSASLTTVSGTETVDLPSDFFTIKALYSVQNNDRILLRYDNNIVSGYDAATNGGSSNYEPSYYFRGNKLVLRPIPGFSSSTALSLEYTAFPETLLTGSDTMTVAISPLFKELVVMYGVYKAKMKDDLVNGSNTRGAAEAHLADLYNNFKHQVVDRSKFPLRITPFNPY